MARERVSVEQTPERAKGAHHDREDSFLHFSSVLSAEDDHLVTLEVDLDGSLRSHTGSETIRRELSSVVNGEIRSSEFGELLLRRSDKHCSKGARCQLTAWNRAH